MHTCRVISEHERLLVSITATKIGLAQDILVAILNLLVKNTVLPDENRCSCSLIMVTYN